MVEQAVWSGEAGGSKPSTLTINRKDKVLEMRANGCTYADIIKETGLAKSTVSYYCNDNSRTVVENYQRTHRQRVKKFLDDVKSSSGCKNCQEKDVSCLDFHHRDKKKKEFTIGAVVMANKYSIARVKREVAKCDVLCANCHRKEEYRLRSARVAE